MNIRILSLKIIILAAVGLIGVTSSVLAQTKVGEKIGDWTLQCQAVSTKKNICAISQVFINTKTNQHVLSIDLRPAGDGSGVALVALAPLGTYLPSGLAAKVDEGKQFEFTWQRCSNQGCEAIAVIDQDIKTALKAGKALFVAYKLQPAADAVTVSASLKGVAQGMEVLGIK